MNTEKYDVIVIGGGNAGIGVTVATRAAGALGGDVRGARARRISFN